MAKRRRPRHRRVSAAYAPHLEDIAAIYVDAGKAVETTARRVREELDLPLTPNTLRTWRARSAEFAAAVEAAEIAAAEAAKLDPEIRSPKDVAWLEARQEELRDAYDGEEDEKRRAAIRKEMMTISAALRAEEKHVADLRDRAARREFAAFLRSFVEFVKTKFARQADVIVPVLRQALQSLPSIMKGGRG